MPEWAPRKVENYCNTSTTDELGKNLIKPSFDDASANKSDDHDVDFISSFFICINLKGIDHGVCEWIWSFVKVFVTFIENKACAAFDFSLMESDWAEWTCELTLIPSDWTMKMLSFWCANINDESALLLWKLFIHRQHQHQQQQQALNPTTKDDKISTLFVCHHRSGILTNGNNQRRQRRTENLIKFKRA